MRVEDIVVGNEVMLLKDIEEVQLAFRPAKGELRKRRVVVYDSSMKHYIGQRGIVLRKDGEGVTQVQYKDVKYNSFAKLSIVRPCKAACSVILYGPALLINPQSPSSR